MPALSRRSLLATLPVALAACSRPAAPTSAPASPATSAVATRATTSPAPTPARTTATPSPTPTPTPVPYPGESIAWLRQQRWGTEGDIRTVRELQAGQGFRRYEINWSSDGITIDGFMNVPAGEGPFPVLVVCHGYTPTASYDLLTYTTEHADAFARAGFLVLHPSYRNHRGSGTGDNPFRIGYAKDVLNLAAMARRLPQGDHRPVGMWGHSMGGGISISVLAVAPELIGASVLYGATNGDEVKNYYKLQEWRAARGEPLPTDLPVKPDDDPALYQAISPGNFLDGLKVPIQIHHGGQDEQVPLQWSYDLDAQLARTGTPHELFVYPGSLHNVAGAQLNQLLTRCIAFYAEKLKG